MHKTPIRVKPLGRVTVPVCDIAAVSPFGRLMRGELRVGVALCRDFTSGIMWSEAPESMTTHKILQQRCDMISCLRSETQHHPLLQVNLLGLAGAVAPTEQVARAVVG